MAAPIALALGLAALILSAIPRGGELTWEALLAPYSTGTPLPGDFRVEAIRRGSGNDVVLDVRRPSDGATVEMHILPRGRWPGVPESRSFGIGFEIPRSSARESVALTDVIAETIRARDHGLPAPDAIALRRGEDASALPWWLAMLRGGRGVLLGAGLAGLGLLVLLGPARRRADLAGLGLGAIAIVAALAGTPPLRSDLGAAWTLPLAAALVLVGLGGRVPGGTADRRCAIGLGALALALRAGLGPWGPLHVNGHMARFIDGPLRHPQEIAAYGPGFAEIFGPVAWLAPAAPDWAIFAANAALSALVAPLAYAIARLVGLGRVGAGIAGLLLAADPVAIRGGATESYFPIIVFLALAGTALVLLALRRGRGGGAAALTLAAGLLLAEATRVHPAAWILVALVPAVLLAGDAPGVLARAVTMLAVAAVIGGVVIATSGDALIDALGNILSGTVLRPQTPPATPLLWIGLGAALYALLSTRRWLAVPAALCLAAMVMTRPAYDASWIWLHNYYRLFLTVPLIAAVALVPAPLLRQRWLLLAAALALAALWVRDGLPIIGARTTDHLEFRWARAQLASLPADCRVVYLASAAERGVLLPTYLRPPEASAALHQRDRRGIDAALTAPGCTYYVRTSLCSSADGRAACDEVERRLRLTPVARASFPAVPSSQFLPYDRDPVEAVLSRVE